MPPEVWSVEKVGHNFHKVQKSIITQEKNGQETQTGTSQERKHIIKKHRRGIRPQLDNASPTLNNSIAVAPALLRMCT